MGRRIQDLEQKAGQGLDEVARRLLRYRVVRGPAAKLANSRTAGIMATRLDQVRADRLRTQIRNGPVPHHVGIIMDGNRRFAQVLGLRDLGMGHVAGQERLENVLDWCLEVGVRVLTVYAFSMENFERVDDERELLMELFEHNFRKMAEDPRVHRNQIRVRAIGHLELLPQSVQDAARHVMERTAHYDQYHFNVAVAYGGRQEIVRAVQEVAREVRDGKRDVESVDVEAIRRHLYTADLPDPDFIIRTSGEERVSNFLLWQLAYAELYFADVYWPALSRFQFLRALQEYQRRQRRFGK